MKSVIQESAGKEDMTWYERCEEKMRNILGSENDEVQKNQTKKK